MQTSSRACSPKGSPCKQVRPVFSVASSLPSARPRGPEKTTEACVCLRETEAYACLRERLRAARSVYSPLWGLRTEEAGWLWRARGSCVAREVAEAMLPPWERHKRMSHPYGTLVLSPKQPPFPLPRRSLSTHPSSGDYVPPVFEKPGGPSAPGATVREKLWRGTRRSWSAKSYLCWSCAQGSPMTYVGPHVQACYGPSGFCGLSLN